MLTFQRSAHARARAACSRRYQRSDSRGCSGARWRPALALAKLWNARAILCDSVTRSHPGLYWQARPRDDMVHKDLVS